MTEMHTSSDVRRDSLTPVFRPTDITDFPVIQHTFTDNVENKALVFIIAGHWLEKQTVKTLTHKND